MPLGAPEKMSLRPIMPSLGENNTSASTSNNISASTSNSNPSQSTSESPNSDFRHKHQGDKSQDLGLLLSKRRRVPESITRNACLNCKKARAKCDGKKPCTRCNTRAEQAPCVYEVHIKHAKEELMKQIHDLRTKDRLTDRILKALQSDDQAMDVLRALRNGDSHETIVEWLGRLSIEEQESFSPVDSVHSAFGSSDQDGHQSDFSWTSVTRDSAVLDHLFQLYFAWVHPVSTLFSEGHFVESYKGLNHRHCSSLLVNAMCALACHFHTLSKDDEVDYDQLGIQFAEAFRAGFEPDDKSITSIQATAVMFLVDLGRGFGLRASSYLRLACDSIAEISTAVDELPCVMKKTIQGIRCLSVEWAQVTFQSPITLGFRAVEDTHDEEISLDESSWYFYRYEEDRCPAWPALLATMNREKMKLINIISDVSSMMYGPYSKTITAHHVLEQYGRFLAWRTAVPHVIGDVESNNQALPHVLSLLILYDYAVLQLLRPLIDLDGFPSVLVEEVVWTHAQHALFLLENYYRTHYTCRYQPVLQMFAISSICDLVARFFPTKSTNDIRTKDGPEAITLGLEVLQDSLVGFPAAGAIHELLRRAAVGCSVRLPHSLDHLMAPPRSPCPTYSYEDFINVCTRPSYHQPVWSVREKFDKKLAEDWYNQSPEYGFKAPEPGERSLRGLQNEPDRGVQYLMQITNLLNRN